MSGEQRDPRSLFRLSSNCGLRLEAAASLYCSGYNTLL